MFEEKTLQLPAGSTNLPHDDLWLNPESQYVRFSHPSSVTQDRLFSSSVTRANFMLTRQHGCIRYFIGPTQTCLDMYWCAQKAHLARGPAAIWEEPLTHAKWKTMHRWQYQPHSKSECDLVPHFDLAASLTSQRLLNRARHPQQALSRTEVQSGCPQLYLTCSPGVFRCVCKSQLLLLQTWLYTLSKNLLTLKVPGCWTYRVAQYGLKKCHIIFTDTASVTFTWRYDFPLVGLYQTYLFVLSTERDM